MQEEKRFELVSNYKPTGDQPEAIAKLVESIQAGHREQTLLGVTGSGKTFTMANVIAQLNRPTLVLAHNKTLAAQLCSEFREFFPNNAVEYFVSYYDYYQPEAYIAQTDTYIEKDSAVNDEIDKLRHSATSRFPNAGTSSSWRPFRAFIRWATPSITARMVFRCGRACSSSATRCLKSSSRCSMNATTSTLCATSSA